VSARADAPSELYLNFMDILTETVRSASRPPAAQTHLAWPLSHLAALLQSPLRRVSVARAGAYVRTRVFVTVFVFVRAWVRGVGGWRMWFVCWHCGTAGLEEHRGTCHVCSRVRRSSRRCCIGSRFAVFLSCCVATVVSRVATQWCSMSTSSYPLRRKKLMVPLCRDEIADCSEKAYVQHASCSMHHATRFAQHTYNVPPCNRLGPRYNVRRAMFGLQPTTSCMQHTSCNLKARHIIL
jgi:hypothetical protein